MSWDEHCGIYHCSDGPHLSWWQALIRTDEWKSWYEYNNTKNRLYDVDEVQECGWMSKQHAKDFLKFVKDKDKKICELECFIGENEITRICPHGKLFISDKLVQDLL